MDNVGLNKLDELALKMSDLKEAQSRLQNTVNEPFQPPPGIQGLEDMIRDMNETHRETQDQMSRIARSISSIGSAMSHLTEMTSHSRKASSNDVSSVKDSPEVRERHVPRKKTRPLSPERRENAARMRRERCADCRRRRVAVRSLESCDNLCLVTKSKRPISATQVIEKQRYSREQSMILRRIPKTRSALNLIRTTNGHATRYLGSMPLLWKMPASFVMKSLIYWLHTSVGGTLSTHTASASVIITTTGTPQATSVSLSDTW